VLTRIHRQTSAATRDDVRACRDTITTATIDLQSHLQAVQTKLENLTQRAEHGTDLNEPVRARVEAELLSTEKGIQFCRELSEAIQKFHDGFFGDEGARAAAPDPVASSEALFGEGLSGCLHHMRFTLAQLEKNRERLHASIGTTPRSAMSPEDKAASEKLQTEARTIRNCLDFFSDVDEVLESRMSNIENHADGDDIIQFMVSTDGNLLQGKNRGSGKRLKQAGGHLSNDSFQQMSQDFKEISIHERLRQGQSSSSAASSTAKAESTDTVSNSPFGKRYGMGLPLGNQSEQMGTTKPPSR